MVTRLDMEVVVENGRPSIHSLSKPTCSHLFLFPLINGVSENHLETYPTSRNVVVAVVCLIYLVMIFYKDKYSQQEDHHHSGRVCVYVNYMGVWW